jgi:uncharacterized protein (TIGR00290 family)
MQTLKSLYDFQMVFGDIFLEDVRNYREEKLSILDIKAIFPLWGENTKHLAEKFIELGFKAIITCVDSHSLNKKFIGLNYNQNFLKSLPENIDPCGENGEFHTFVYDGPFFSKPIQFQKGEIVFRENRFYFIDLE